MSTWSPFDNDADAKDWYDKYVEDKKKKRNEGIPPLPDPPEPSVAISGKYKDDCQCEHCKNRRAHEFMMTWKWEALRAAQLFFGYRSTWFLFGMLLVALIWKFS